MGQNIRRLAEPLGLEFAELTHLPNSGLALQASEFARDSGKFEPFHEQLFYSYFTVGENIGDIDVIINLGQIVGLDGVQLRTALIKGSYQFRLQETQLEAATWGVTAAPTFIVEGKDYIVGAQPLEVFRDVLKSYPNPN